MTAEPDLTSHVTPAASTREPHKPPERVCGVCGEKLPAGHVRHPGCDVRWLKTVSDTTEVAGETDNAR